MKEVGKKASGIAIIILGVLIGLSANLVSWTSIKFWVLFLVGLGCWGTGTFVFLLENEEKKRTWAGWVGSIMGVLFTPLLYLYADSLRRLAELQTLPSTKYTILQGISAGLFVLFLFMVFKRILVQTMTAKKKGEK